MRFRLKAIICTPQYIKIQQDVTSETKEKAFNNFAELVEAINADIGGYDIDFYETSIIG